MTRFGTICCLAAGLALAGCSEQQLSRLTGAKPAAQCPPPVQEPACPPAPAKVEAKAEASAKTETVVTETRARVVKKRRAKVRRYAGAERVESEYARGLAGGSSYSRYEEREYARPYPGEGRVYKRYEGDGGKRGYAYSYESSESSSESSRYSEESSSSGYAAGGAWGSGYAYSQTSGGFDPRRETYYAAGRDGRGYLVWPGKRP